MKNLSLTGVVSLSMAFVLASCKTTTSEVDVEQLKGAFIFTAADGDRLRVTPYGGEMVRLQSVRKNETFYEDNHYEMVESHDWPRNFKLIEQADRFLLENTRLKLKIDKSTLAVRFFLDDLEILAESKAVQWQGSKIKVEFEFDDQEHFTGLGHGFYAREKSLDLKGQEINRVYGSQPIEQAPLIVPFYLSNKGYGIFLNSTFGNTFRFGKDQEYSVEIDDLGFDGRMDYFFIAGPELKQVLNNYTDLTGKPRLPQKSIFGLQLSDKGHDHNSDTPSDLKWWQQKIKQHRDAGFPLDHVVNDNRWRAAGGKRCESKLDWDQKRYPDPAAYQKWLEDMGLTITLDFNRCIGQYSEGWKSSFNLPRTGEIEFPNSAPDLTNEAFQNWFWHVFENKALKPEQHYPGDALWIDEFDEQGHAPKDMVLSNGRSSGEMRNYWFFLIAKSLVEKGWDQSAINKRPFVWVRGMTAGGQRYASLWSGDIYPNYNDMTAQIRGMQLAGLSGFPYWGHDAGGFFDWNEGLGPDEEMYQRWAMAFGSFSPIWKPHGMGQSRWPLDRTKDSQIAAEKYAKLRYELMPYIYSAAHEAARTGLPMTRAMLLDYQNSERAWQFDLQYMWGPNMLIAPLTADKGDKQVWLPKGLWYEFFTHAQQEGDQIVTVTPKLDELPIFVKAGAIIPKRNYALSTAFIDKKQLQLDIFTGSNGDYTLFEDDDVTEQYRLQQRLRETKVSYNDANRKLIIAPAVGEFDGANNKRDLTIRFIGIDNVNYVLVNHQRRQMKKVGDTITLSVEGQAVDKPLTIELK